MRLDFIRDLYERSGPYASVYLETSRNTEDAATVVELRWRQTRELLEEYGAPGDVADRMGDLITDPGAAAPGRAVFASADTLFTEPLPMPPRREIARWSPLPHVTPLLAQRGEQAPHILVLADHAGSDVIVVARGQRRELVVRADDWPIQKTGQGGWSQPRYEREVEETWRRNAAATAEVVSKEAAAAEAEVIVVGGDPRSRHMILERLGPDAAARAVAAAHGSRAPGAMPGAYLHDVESALSAWLRRRQADLVDEHRRGPSVAGLAETARVLREARAERVLMADDPSSTATLWIGPEGTHLSADRDELREWGVADPVEERADAAIARAAAVTEAELWFVPSLDVPDRIGATLRY
ncbi:hypothetical protein J5X84_33185 [Streptosporangiaceae bacterium NEAU-GS5]|nr:hypothetical protein [Streptosporangiaceae bacterium NEAU-GS5]